jgi:hypothetical protein
LYRAGVPRHPPYFLSEGILKNISLYPLSFPLPFIFAIFLGAPVFSFADDGNIIVLDCTKSSMASELTSKFPTVYLSRESFDRSKFSDKGEISKNDFDGLVRTGLKIPKGTIRFKIGKNDEVDVYIVTSIRMDTFEQAIAPAALPIQWASDPITFVTSPSSQKSGPVTTASQPITLSILRTARFLLQEQQRATSLQSGGAATASSVFGVTFKEPAPLLGPVERPPSEKGYYYYRQKYKLKFENSTLALSFEDQNGNQENVATIITGSPENWFLTAGGPLYAYNPHSNSSGGNPTGLYVGLNWTPNDIYDPDLRLLIVNIMDVNTTNPASAVGLVGLGMGFPKIASFIPLSTLSVTETLAYNMNLSQFQLLTMITYDVTDVLQLLKL